MDTINPPAEINSSSNRVDFSISMEKANWAAIAFAIPIVAFLFTLFGLIWGFEKPIVEVSSTFQNPKQLLKVDLIFIGIFIAGVILHELIHGLTWLAASNKTMSSLKFGFQLKTFTPYAHIREPISAKAYRLGTIMPGLLTGAIPAIIGIALGNVGITLLAGLFLVAACGDFTILWLIRKVDPSTLVEDHPTRAGCFLISS